MTVKIKKAKKIKKPSMRNTFKLLLILSFFGYLYSALGLRSENIKLSLYSQQQEREIKELNDDIEQLSTNLSETKRFENFENLVKKYNLEKRPDNIVYLKRNK